MPEIKRRQVPPPVCDICHFSRPAVQLKHIEQTNGVVIKVCAVCLHTKHESFGECPVCLEPIVIEHDYYSRLEIGQYPGLISVHDRCHRQYMQQREPLLVMECVHCGEVCAYNESHYCTSCYKMLFKPCPCGSGELRLEKHIVFRRPGNGDILPHRAFCSHCADQYYYCPHCSSYCGVESKAERGDHTACAWCIDKLGTCEYCLEFPVLLGEKVGGKRVCSLCSERAGVCDTCGKISFDCGAMYHKHHNRNKSCMSCIGSPIMPHNFKKPPIFYGGPDPFFGFENEYEFEAGEYKAATDRLRKWAAERKDMYHLVHDGSLKYGVEVVSQPASFDYWMSLPEILPPEQDIPNRIEKGTAGCHVHISKSAFTNEHLFKFLSFLNDNFENFLPIFGRGIGHYCQDINVPFDKFAELKEQLQPEYDHKYWWINMKNSPTVEVRVFIAAQNDADIKSNLQMLYSLFEYTKNIGCNDMEWREYYKFIARDPRFYILADSLEKKPKPQAQLPKKFNEQARPVYQRVPILRQVQPVDYEVRWGGVIEQDVIDGLLEVPQPEEEDDD